ncbi:hypothetical protein ACI7YT_03060 [Microbacterium sp. M]|uniref:hypothetical protein n=1 Tax=Microbacterium sp. M TaxID=3377125 RepID=UPI00386E431A
MREPSGASNSSARSELLTRDVDRLIGGHHGHLVRFDRRHDVEPHVHRDDGDDRHEQGDQ